MENEDWIQKAVSKHPGLLRQKLGIKADHDIPEAKLEKAAHSKSPALAKEARLAETLKHMHKNDGAMADSHFETTKHFSTDSKAISCMKSADEFIKHVHAKNGMKNK